MKARKKLRIVWFIALIAYVVSAFTVYTSNDLYTQEYWDETAQKVAAQYASDRELGKNFTNFVKSLSAASGNQTIESGDGKVYSIVIKDGEKTYVGGAEIGTRKTIDTKTTELIGGDKYWATENPLTDKWGTGYSSDYGEATPGAGTITVYVFKELSTRETSKISSSISTGLLKNANVTPDTGTATQLAGGLVPIINAFLGILVIAISIGMTVFTTLDCVYLAFPVFQQSIDTSVENGGKGTHTRKDGSTSSRFVTDEARTALKDGREQGKSPWLLYLTKRAAAFIFLAIVLFILVTGNIFAIMTLVTDILEGLFSVIFG